MDAPVSDRPRSASSPRGCGSCCVADPNRALFEEVVGLLATVLNELVFVGCTTGFFVTDPAATGIRPTKDVDAIVDVTSYARYTALADACEPSDSLRTPPRAHRCAA